MKIKSNVKAGGADTSPTDLIGMIGPNGKSMIGPNGSPISNPIGMTGLHG